MSKTEKSLSRVKATAFIDFKPAELHLNKDWIIVYYSKNPITQKLERFRLRVPVLKSKSERLKLAKKIVVEINDKLLSGWSPFTEESGKNFKTFEVSLKDFKTRLDKMIADGVLRPDTKRTYNSNSNILELYVKNFNKISFALEINRKFCVNYLDWIYIDRKGSPRTRNNHLVFVKLFCSFLVDRGVLAENPAIGIKPLKLTKKKRILFSEEIKNKISKYWNTLNNGFPVMGKTTYFCFIRNTELSKLKVSDVNLQTGTLFVPAESSKNRKGESVTIPENFLPIIQKHIEGVPGDYFLFSDNDFFPGIKKMPIRKIQTYWDKLRNELKLGSEHQFYGLKDTGITDLLDSGVPAIRVRDQARHSDLRITEVYAQRRDSSDEFVKNANFNI